MWIEREGFWVNKSFPSSTIDIKWPIGGDGYRTMASSMAARTLSYTFVCTWRDRKRESKQSVWSSFKKKGIMSQTASEHEIGSDTRCCTKVFNDLSIYLLHNRSQSLSSSFLVLCQNSKIVATYQLILNFLEQ
jgi:hypothetical protein